MVDITPERLFEFVWSIPGTEPLGKRQFMAMLQRIGSGDGCPGRLWRSAGAQSAASAVPAEKGDQARTCISGLDVVAGLIVR